MIFNFPLGKPDKKGNVEASTALNTEAVKDESGNFLPRVFVDSNDGKVDDYGALLPADDEEVLHGRRFHWGFARTYSTDQLEKRDSSIKIVHNIERAEDDGSSDSSANDTKMSPLEEAPSGPFKDPLMCKAFEITQSLYASNEKEGMGHYLWNSIWPKLPSGRPCYNPRGKYCVKLYLCGKWRRVVVSDVVPLDESGQCLLASSAKPFEIWPTIISKAVYAVYCACGYSDVPVFCNDELSDTAARFIGFVLQCLNGWTPSLPYSLLSAYQSTDIRILESILGQIRCSIPCVSELQIPGFNPTVPKDFNSDMDGMVSKTLKDFIYFNKLFIFF